MIEVVAKRLDDTRSLPTSPGEFKICCNDKGEPARLVFACPCGCGDIGGIGLPPGNQQGPTWTWNGDHDKPTCTPSIRFLSGCQWHGYLTDGVFRSC